MARGGLEGADRLAQRLARIPQAIRDKGEEAVLKEAHRMADRMRGIVPVDQGDLKESIAVTPAGERTPSYSHPGGSHEVPKGAAEVTAGNSKVRYAHLVEYGTQKTRANPFFWPVVRTEKKRARQRINRAIKKAIKETKR